MSIASIFRMGGGALARSVLTGGFIKISPESTAIRAIQKQINQGRIPYGTRDQIRSVVRRVARQISAAGRIDPASQVPLADRFLPRTPELEFSSRYNYTYRTAIEYQTPGGRKTYRTSVTVNSRNSLTYQEILDAARRSLFNRTDSYKNVANDDRWQEVRQSWTLTDFQVISAGRK